MGLFVCGLFGCESFGLDVDGRLESAILCPVVVFLSDPFRPQTLCLFSLVVDEPFSNLLLGDFGLCPVGVDLEGEVVDSGSERGLGGVDRQISI
jgi:hypothetical protein